MKEEWPKKPRICAVCGSMQKRLVFQQRFSEMSDGTILDGYDVVVCKKCGFGFADNLPGQEAFNTYYREMSKYEHQDRGGQTNEFDKRRFAATIAVIRQFVHPQARILDVGCATGGLLYELRKSGYQNLLGLDPSPVCAVTGKELYGIPVLSGSLSEMAPDSGPFDLIILGAVLEHMLHPDVALSNVKQLLSAEGMVYVEVPDVTRFTECCDAPFQEFSIEHINFFSPTSLVNLLQAHGFILVSLQRDSIERDGRTMAHEIKALFHRSENLSESSAFHDVESEPALSAYVKRSNEIERRIHAVIDSLRENGRPIIVWGVGTHTQRLLATSSLAKANILAFVDSNPRYQGKTLNGIPIIAPTDVKDKSEPILISSRDFQHEIVKMIRDELNCDNELILLYELECKELL